jgi:hypothetical protein
MIVNIANEIFTKLKEDLTGVELTTSYETAPPTYPLVSFSELSNNAYLDTKDSSGEYHNQVSFEVNIFTEGSTRKNDALEIRVLVDEILSNYYGLGRDFSNEIPNYLNSNIYRYVMRYSCLVDKNKMIYGR